MAKKPPTSKMTPAEARKLQETKDANRAERVIDRSEGRDTRMGRDGGTNRRLRR
jgi:hypothetical protein